MTTTASRLIAGAVRDDKRGAAVGRSAILFLALPMLGAWLSARPQLVDYAAVLSLVLVLRRVEVGLGRSGAVALIGLLAAALVTCTAPRSSLSSIAGACALLLLGELTSASGTVADGLAS